MPVSNSRYELLHKRLIRFTRVLRGLENGSGEALHRTRVASRRLRELLPVLQLDGDAAGRLAKRLRRVTQHLGSVRELDVLLLLVDELHESGRYDEAALSRVSGAIAQERAAAREKLLSRLPMGELRRLSKKLEKTADKLREEEPGRRADRASRWAIEARVGHRAEAVAKAVDAAGNVYLGDRVHAVRIALKKFRYAVELESEISDDQGWRRDLALLKRVQGLLGRLHDRQVLIDFVREVQASLSPPNLSLWRSLDSLLTSIDKECRRLHARYVREAAELAALCERIVGRAASVSSRRRAG